MEARTILEGEVEESRKTPVDELLATPSPAHVPISEDVQVSLRNVPIHADIEILETWEVTEAELELLAEDTPKVDFAGELGAGQMRSSHHAMARDLANGKPLVDVSRYYGLPMVTLRALMEAPAFQELMGEYKGVAEVSFSMEGKMTALAHDSLDEIRTRLETEPVKFTTAQLLTLGGDMLDRTGHSKVSRHVQLTGGLGGTDLEAIKKDEPQLGGSKAIGAPAAGSAAD